MTPLVDVSQADRDAAADLNHAIATDETLLKLCEGGPLPLVPSRLILPAFARHRLTAEQAKDAEIERLREVLGPVLHWYQHDEQEDRPVAEIIADVVEDLQHDRAVALAAASLRRAGGNLSICAQTTGGTAGPDAGLKLAIEQYREAAARIDTILNKKDAPHDD